MVGPIDDDGDGDDNDDNGDDDEDLKNGGSY